MPSNNSKYAVRSSLVSGSTVFNKQAKNYDRCASAESFCPDPNREAKPTNLAYEVSRDILKPAQRRMDTQLSYTAFKYMSKKEKGSVMRRDPNSHFEKNVKKYTYQGAAAKFAYDLNPERGVKQQGHIKATKKAAPWDLQKPRDSSVYNISELSNLKKTDQPLRHAFALKRTNLLLSEGRRQKPKSAVSRPYIDKSGAESRLVRDPSAVHRKNRLLLL